MTKNKPISESKAKELYARYAKNINIDFLQVTFDAGVGVQMDVHGDKKSLKTEKNITFRSSTMNTTDGKWKVWVYRDSSYKWQQDAFELQEGTKEEFLRVMLERATGVDAAGNKVQITN